MDENKDFLLKRTPVTKVQLAGLCLSAFFLLSIGIGVWVLFILPALGSPDAMSVTLLIVGSVFSIFFIYLAWLNIRRIFAGGTSKG